MAQKLQKTFNGLVKEFIWVKPIFKEEPKSNKVFKGIGINKEVKKSINMIIVIDGINSHDFGI